MTQQPFTPEAYKDIYSKVPKLCVDLVIRKGDAILLTLRTLPSWYGQWHLPGGSTFYKERMVDAVHRAARDELGITVKIVELLGYIEFPSEEQERGFGWSVSLPFLCDHVSGDVRTDDQAGEARWFTEVPEKTIAEHQAFLRSHWQRIMQR